MLVCTHISLVALHPDMIPSPQALRSLIPDFAWTWETPDASLALHARSLRAITSPDCGHRSPLLDLAKGRSNINPLKKIGYEKKRKSLTAGVIVNTLWGVWGRCSCWCSWQGSQSCSSAEWAWSDLLPAAPRTESYCSACPVWVQNLFVTSPPDQLCK